MQRGSQKLGVCRRPGRALLGMSARLRHPKICFFINLSRGRQRAEALILGRDFFRSQLVATKFCGQNGQSANAARVACRRTLRRAARKVTLSSRSALPRKTASLFMRSINFLKLARATAKSSGAVRRCLSIRWTPTVIQACKESPQVGWISSVPAVSSAVFQSASSNALSSKYDGICI